MASVMSILAKVTTSFLHYMSEISTDTEYFTHVVLFFYFSLV